MQGREVASCAPLRLVMAHCGRHPNSDPADRLPRLENRNWLRGGSGPCPSAAPRHLPLIPLPRGRSRLPASAEAAAGKAENLVSCGVIVVEVIQHHFATEGAIRSDEIPPPFAKPIFGEARQPLRDKSEPEDPGCWASSHYAATAASLARRSICCSQSCQIMTQPASSQVPHHDVKRRRSTVLMTLGCSRLGNVSTPRVSSAMSF